ncbi:hypothetical protein Q5Y75_07055 [Ruegeria sp. 2205SS24-7]|uniref:hypothetical protein n=1 Tax=Ruegeria discodermiae TaxID=3064389 RepID=UPI002741BF89|nr:hypothetical protein [Ruegeria sp. 2205SS24-7]MDP5216970.1 hypothetical protein [Ruegeria sp. 2205SS24-7]
MPESAKINDHEFWSGPRKGEKVKLCLRRWVHSAPIAAPGSQRKPVLLLHNASGSHKIYTIPDSRENQPRCLLDWLVSEGFDPWLLDWRSSYLTVADPDNQKVLTNHGDEFNFHNAAEFDIPMAVKKMQAQLGKEQPIGIVGFCMGAATLAEAIAGGWLDNINVTHAVFMTIGLFFAVPFDTRLKGDERTLERLKVSADSFHSVDPRVREVNEGDEVELQAPWPDELEGLYNMWPGRFKPHNTGQSQSEPSDVRCALEMYNRLSFIYGTTYEERKLVPEIHRPEGSRQPELVGQFGAMPLHMLIHGAQDVRRGCAADYNSSEELKDAQLLSSDALARFGKLERVTLITGEKNRVWHRESIDLMYEWLHRLPSNHWRKLNKIIYPDFGHLDLLWGKDSVRKVFPEIKHGLEN